MSAIVSAIMTKVSIEEFRQKALAKGLRGKTIELLLEEDLDDENILKRLTPGQLELFFTKCKVSVGQQNAVQAWIEELKEAASKQVVIKYSSSESKLHTSDIQQKSDETKLTTDDTEKPADDIKPTGEIEEPADASTVTAGFVTDQVSLLESRSQHYYGNDKATAYTSQMRQDQDEMPRTGFQTDLSKLTGDPQQNLNMGAKLKSSLVQQLSDEGFTYVTAHIHQLVEQHSQSKVNIGITGQTGTGKSTLINTLRSLLPTDVGAAAVGTSETTKTVTPYEFSGNDSVILWDVPGVNTKLFPKSTYIEKVGLLRFDALIICTSQRFSELDIWLAKEVTKCQIPFYFARTKIDLDIKAAAEDHGTPEYEAIRQIRTDISGQLGKDNIEAKALYLICGKFRLNGQLKWDFPKLNEELINNAPSKNTAALVEVLIACSEEIIEKKRKELMSYVDNIARIAAEKATVNKHEDVISAATNSYFRWFGLYPELLQKYSVKLMALREKLQQSYAGLLEAANPTPGALPQEEQLATVLQEFKQLETTNKEKKPKKPIFARFRKLKRKKESYSPCVIEDVEADTAARLQQMKTTVFEEARDILHDILDSCVDVSLGILQHRKLMSDVE